MQTAITSPKKGSNYEENNKSWKLKEFTFEAGWGREWEREGGLMQMQLSTDLVKFENHILSNTTIIET